MNILNALNWRYAVKQFSQEKIDDQRLSELLDYTRLSASSYGLQPYRLLVVKSAEVRQQLLAHSYGQEKVVEASHLLVFAVETAVNDDYIDTFMQHTADIRGLPIDQLQGFATHVKSALRSQTTGQRLAWAKNQAYIALGNLLTCAALMEIDTCPMEGIGADGYDNVLQLADKGLSTTVICTLGIRHADDESAHMQKVRAHTNEIIIEI